MIHPGRNGKNKMEDFFDKIGTSITNTVDTVVGFFQDVIAGVESAIEGDGFTEGYNKSQGANYERNKRKHDDAVKTLASYKSGDDFSFNRLGPSMQAKKIKKQEDKIREEIEGKQTQDLRQASFIEYVKPREFLFEGETVSGLLNLFIWDRLPVSRIERPPQKDGDAFSLTELRQPQEKRNQTKFDKTYTVFSWPTGLTAAIAGQHTIQFNTSIRVRVKSRGNSPFASPFFNDPFFGFGREESLTVKSDLINIEVKALPMLDRPGSFQGAIGTFSCRSIPNSDRVSLGVPVRLIFEIEGTGNFSAMPAPILNSDSNFKIGPPAFSFEGNEITMHEGKQLFEYILTLDR